MPTRRRSTASPTIATRTSATVTRPPISIPSPADEPGDDFELPPPPDVLTADSVSEWMQSAALLLDEKSQVRKRLLGVVQRHEFRKTKVAQRKARESR